MCICWFSGYVDPSSPFRCEETNFRLYFEAQEIVSTKGISFVSVYCKSVFIFDWLNQSP